MDSRGSPVIRSSLQADKRMNKNKNENDFKSKKSKKSEKISYFVKYTSFSCHRHKKNLFQMAPISYQISRLK